ncbi:hypothetical protein PoB_001753500 [Plakobranchus ocellatus]|uniref:Uncharacterized protein n=1 Tax=Plakobranchus ocellatus TaxID=259542 RepID=A0AAV3Z8Z7_9GAST|nr:hypothetical protein PoB_001753500 [Plakobranchus ocellatus]
MAFFGRHRSAPQLLDMGDNTYVIVGLHSPTEEEDEEDDGHCQWENTVDIEITPAPGSTGRLDDPDGSGSISGESAGDTTLLATGSSSTSPAMTITDTPSLPSHSPTRSFSHSPSVSPSISPPHSPERYPSPAPSPDVLLRKKTRPAPLPPSMVLLPPASSISPEQRHSYALDGVKPYRTSTDSDSITSEPHLFYQTSTDSGDMLPESARGSNFPGELAGVDHLRKHYILKHSGHMDDQMLGSSLRSSRPSQFPRDRSALFRIREAFRSPQINRKKSKKDKNRTSGSGIDENCGDGKSPRSTTLKVEDALRGGELSDSPRQRKRKGEDAQKSPKPRKRGEYDQAQDMSDWIIPRGYSEIEIDHEFECKLVLVITIMIIKLFVVVVINNHDDKEEVFDDDEDEE